MLPSSPTHVTTISLSYYWLLLKISFNHKIQKHENSSCHEVLSYYYNIERFWFNRYQKCTKKKKCNTNQVVLRMYLRIHAFILESYLFISLYLIQFVCNFI